MLLLFVEEVAKQSNEELRRRPDKMRIGLTSNAGDATNVRPGKSLFP